MTPEAARLQAATEQFGHGSTEWASAMCDLGNALLGTGRPDRAADCFRQAASAKPRDDESRKDRLTYLSNLGVALTWAGRHREAEKELRRGLKERLAFYGREHAGYAFGLEPLADLLRRRGKLRAARPVAEEAVTNLWRNGHAKLSSALALRAAIIEASGTGEPPFGDLSPLPDEIVAEAGSIVAQMPDVGESLLPATIELLGERLGPDHPATLAALTSLAKLGAERAAAAFESAYARAGDPRSRSLVLRRWGLVLREAGRLGPAEERLTEAVRQGRLGSDNTTLGQAAVALGILLQHQDRLDEAQTAFEEGLAALDAAHPDAIIGRSHLGAARDGETRGCDPDRLSASLAGAFSDFVRTRLPADLLDRLDVSIADNDFHLEVSLNRKPTEAELERLNEVIAAAHEEFRLSWCASARRP